jgi:maltose alpha-D-glucosyltransferase/alpha-amylase
VEAQLATRSSLLHWTRGMLAIRKRHPVFGLGRYVAVESSNDAVLAFLRVLDEDPEGNDPPETVLCVNNLAQTPQGARLRLLDHGGCALDDMFGGSGFPAIPEDGELSLSLGSRDFFWLRVEPKDGREGREADRG